MALPSPLQLYPKGHGIQLPSLTIDFSVKLPVLQTEQFTCPRLLAYSFPIHLFSSPFPGHAFPIKQMRHKEL